MRNAMKIGLVLAALVAAGVYSVSAEDVSQQAVLNGTVVSVIEAGTPVKEGDVLVSVDSLVGGVPAARADRDGVVKEVPRPEGPDDRQTGRRSGAGEQIKKPAVWHGSFAPQTACPLPFIGILLHLCGCIR